MNDYSPNEFIACYFREPSSSQRHLDRAVAQIEEHTPYRVCDAWLSPRGQVGVLNLSTKPPAEELSRWSSLKSDWLAAQPRFNRLRVRGRMALLRTGYITTPDRRFEASLREDGKRLYGADAGGIAAFCLVRWDGDGDERLFLWSTRPGVRTIASAQADAVLVAGTRPRLVHAVSREFRAPSLDLAYVRSALNGWSLGDLTPYEGTSLLPQDRVLRVSGGDRSLEPHPTPDFQREARIFRKQWPIYRDALREAVEPLRSLRGFELRLSGGKDSRLVAAALWNAGITPSTVICHGPEASPDVQVAQQVANILGWPLQRAKPTFGYRGGLLNTVRYNLALSDGFLATEPRHLAFEVHSLSHDVGPGLVIGHIELQKGGWSSSTPAKRAQLVALGRRRVARWSECVVPELTREARDHVDRYVADLHFDEGAEYGYWINYRFRVGRWLTSHYLAHSKEHLPVYPLIDEKVTRVCSCAPLKHLTSERMLAETTWAFTPALRDLPALEPYRFLTEGHKKMASSPTARETAPAGGATTEAPSCAPAATPDAPVATQPSSPTSRAPSLSPDHLNAIADHVRTGKLRDELRSLMQPRVWAILEQPSIEAMLATQLDQRRLAEFFWACYQASVLHTEGLACW